MTYYDFFLARGKKIRQWNPSRWLLLIGLLFSASEAQVNHPYPRTALQHFGSAPADWYARFDMVILDSYDTKEVRDIKALNAKTLYIYTDGWTAYNASNYRLEPLPSEYLARDSQGNKVQLNWGTQLLDMSILCPKVNGKAYWQSHPEYIASVVDLNLIDGIGSDWCWGKPYGVKDIDLDRNGKNDYVEHGENWVNTKWLEGVTAFIGRLRQLIGPDKLIWINSGQFHTWGWDLANGVMLEKEPGVYKWDWYWRTYKDFMSKAREPHILLMDARPVANDPNNTSDTKNNFRLMRFLLGVTTMGDGYFNYNPLEAGEHYYHSYYDEFDLNLGYPLGAAQELPNGCFARFFDFGAIIVNPTGSPKTVTNGDLSAVAGYRGPYFRFRGGQDPAVNNGAPFSSVDLYGATQGSSGSNPLTLGDAIFLLNQSRVVTADVFIDNLDYGTSPAQKPVKLVGAWQQTTTGELFYSLKERPSQGWYPHAYTTGGDGSQTATFTAKLSIAGAYEILEWHGYFDKTQMATNVPYTVSVGSGQTTKIIDQSKNQGRWNSLGTYSFQAGNAAQVTISNKANGYVVADLIAFVYRSSDANADIVPPAPPTGIKVSN